MNNKVLSGITVVEFGQFIAVPLCGQILADAGAKVIKVEPMEGDATRAAGQVIPGEGRQYLNKNRGKHSIALNLRSPEGLAIARELAARADVVLVNFRPGLAGGFGLDYESIRQTNPRVVYASNTAYGERGPDSQLPGFDFVVRAYSGMYVNDDTVEDRAPDIGLPYCDYMTASLMTVGVMMALYERERTGEGQEIETSLLASSLFLQNQRLMHLDITDGWREEFVKTIPRLRAEGKTWAEVNAAASLEQSYRFHGAYFGAYPTADGGIVVNCGSPGLRRKLLEVTNVEDGWVTDSNWEAPEDVTEHIDRVCEDLRAAFRDQTTTEWLGRLREAGIPVSEIRHWTEVFENRQVLENELLWRCEHEVLGGMTLVGPPIKMSRTPLEPTWASRPLGADTRLVLSELGFGEEKIAQLVAAEVVRTD